MLACVFVCVVCFLCFDGYCCYCCYCIWCLWCGYASVHEGTPGQVQHQASSNHRSVCWASAAIQLVLCECNRCVARGTSVWRAFKAICKSLVVGRCRPASQSRGGQCKSMSMCICACLNRHWMQASARPAGIVRERPGVCEWWVAGRVSVSRGARGRRMCVAVAGAVRVAGAAAMRTFLVNGIF